MFTNPVLSRVLNFLGILEPFRVSYSLYRLEGICDQAKEGLHIMYLSTTNLKNIILYFINIYQTRNEIMLFLEGISN